MINRKKIQSVTRLWVLFCVLVMLFAGTTLASADKGLPPDSGSRLEVIGEIPEIARTEVWVEVETEFDRNNLPEVALDGFTAELLSPSSTVVINEFDQFNDRIEFYNLSASPVDMSDWQVMIYIGSNVLANTYTFPTGFILDPGAYVVLHENDDPVNNTATDLYTAQNLVIQSLGGAISMVDDVGTGVDFVRWNVGMITPPAGSGWVGTNPYLPEEVFFSLGRDASSLDQDYAEDWTLQVPTYGAQNDPTAPLCISLGLITSGSGGVPTYEPTQSDGCDPGYFVPGEVITITADPDSGWEVGQWGQVPAREYLGTNPVIDLSMFLEHSYLWLSYIQSEPAPGSVLVLGPWGDYGFTLEDLGVPYDQVNSNAFAPDWEVLTRYDMVIYQSFQGEPFYINLRASNYATYLDEGGCMWVEADTYDLDPEDNAPNVPYYYFGINSFGSENLADTISGAGTIFSGLGPYDDPEDQYYADLNPYNGAEVAFEDISGNDVGVSKITSNFTTAFITYDFNYLAQLDQAEILATFLDACSIAHTSYAFPTNDDFDTPIVISALNYSNSQGALSIMQATTAGDDPILHDPDDQYYHTVWYSYTPSVTETFRVDTFGSDYDTVLGVWTGTRGSLTEIAINDDVDFPSTLQSQVEIAGEAGVTYYIEIAGYSAAYGELVLNVTGSSGLLFESGFETGDFSEWSRINDGGGWMYVCSEAAINGNWGACVASGDNDKRKQLTDETPVYQTTFSSRINFDINSLAMGEGERFRFLQVKMGDERPYFIVLKYDTGQYYIQLNTKLDDLSKVKTDWILLTDEPHTIEVDWSAATSDGANDGYAELYIDNVLQEALIGLDNDTIYVDKFKVGFTSKLTGKDISGMFYLDDAATSNTGYIGLP